MARLTRWMVAGGCVGAMMLIGCESEYKAAEGDPVVMTSELAVREGMARDTVEKFRAKAPTLDRFFQTAAGYAVFPKITKGGAGLGAAHGEGVVFEGDTIVGYTELTQGTIGLQLGGKTYSEIIFFQTPQRLDNFKQGNMELSAQVSAVAADEGKARTADFAEGVAVFTMPITGLMGEASVGGQKFTYFPKQSDSPRPMRSASDLPPPPSQTSPSPR